MKKEFEALCESLSSELGIPSGGEVHLRLLLSLLTMLAEQQQESEKKLKQLIEGPYKTAEDYLDQAKAETGAKQLKLVDDARKEFASAAGQLAEDHPWYPKAYFQQGVCNDLLGSFGAALISYEKSFEAAIVYQRLTQKSISQKQVAERLGLGTGTIAGPTAGVAAAGVTASLVGGGTTGALAMVGSVFWPATIGLAALYGVTTGCIKLGKVVGRRLNEKKLEGIANFRQDFTSPVAKLLCGRKCSQPTLGRATVVHNGGYLADEQPMKAPDI